MPRRKNEELRGYDPKSDALGADTELPRYPGAKEEPPLLIGQETVHLLSGLVEERDQRPLDGPGGLAVDQLTLEKLTPGTGRKGQQGHESEGVEKGGGRLGPLEPRPGHK